MNKKGVDKKISTFVEQTRDKKGVDKKFLHLLSKQEKI
jgi:hypothetical protein